MKSISKSGFGAGIIIFVAAAIIALPVRTLQYFTVLESDTGFFSKIDWSVYVLGVTATAAILAFLILGFIKRKKIDYSLEVTKRPGQGILCFTAAAGILMSTIGVVLELMNYDSFTSDNKTESIILGAQAVFALFSAVYLVAMGSSFVSGKTNGSEYRLISLSPVIWSIFRLVLRFTRTISYIKVSDLMLEMVMIVFFIIILLYSLNALRSALLRSFSN